MGRFDTLNLRRRSRLAAAGELLFEFYLERAQTRWRCELRDHGKYGVEAQFFMNEQFLIGRTFASYLDPRRTPREMAIAWAEKERKALQSNQE